MLKVLGTNPAPTLQIRPQYLDVVKLAAMQDAPLTFDLRPRIYSGIETEISKKSKTKQSSYDSLLPSSPNIRFLATFLITTAPFLSNTQKRC